MSDEKIRAPRNRTITLSESERQSFRQTLKTLSSQVSIAEVRDTLIYQDMLEAVSKLPSCSVDLLFLDPPYNLNKDFGGAKFKAMGNQEYIEYMDSWMKELVRLLKPDASVYICGDWKCTSAIQLVAEKYFKVRNRITWEREKGRGAKTNWKNCSEDIWFCTVGEDYFFDADAVRLKRKVIAPYKEDGKPKDWEESEEGNFRLTSPSNLWTDLTVPFWSMPENTDHPTQKPEKLVAKVLLASSKPGAVVLDPFMGSGTTAVVAQKLGRHFIGIDSCEEYCCLAAKRLKMAESDKTIQGYTNGVFWERNSLNMQMAEKPPEPAKTQIEEFALFNE
jgi:site-specific DNA-methyltransferase (adenine-specific)